MAPQRNATATFVLAAAAGPERRARPEGPLAMRPPIRERIHPRPHRGRPGRPPTAAGRGSARARQPHAWAPDAWPREDPLRRPVLSAFRGRRPDFARASAGTARRPAQPRRTAHAGAAPNRRAVEVRPPAIPRAASRTAPWAAPLTSGGPTAALGTLRRTRRLWIREVYQPAAERESHLTEVRGVAARRSAGVPQ